jgi:hypothetical protein
MSKAWDLGNNYGKNHAMSTRHLHVLLKQEYQTYEGGANIPINNTEGLCQEGHCRRRVEIGSQGINESVAHDQAQRKPWGGLERRDGVDDLLGSNLSRKLIHQIGKQ